VKLTPGVEKSRFYCSSLECPLHTQTHQPSSLNYGVGVVFVVHRRWLSRSQTEDVRADNAAEADCREMG